MPPTTPTAPAPTAAEVDALAQKYGDGARINVVQRIGRPVEAIERLERLERLDQKDRRDAEERRENKQRAQARLAALDAKDAADAADATAVGRELLEKLVSAGQGHLTAGSPTAAGLARLARQLQQLDGSIAGGLLAYVERARGLLRDARDGKNPLEGYVPSIPSGHALELGSATFGEYEAAGVAAMRGAAFVLVAGGLGERLGFSGIKLSLPAEMLTRRTYLELYAAHLKALQHECGKPLPLVLMTSGDTDAPTRALLAERRHFGLDPGHVHIIKQEKVPCLADGDASLALDPNDRYALLTKPHGHGDVHALLHASGLARTLAAGGATHLVFLQDTNAQVFAAVPAALGVSVRHSLALNSLSVRRRGGDASGALLALARASDGRRVVANVEYNQLDALVRASLDSRGDVSDATGWSPYPGNCNQLVFELQTYLATLEASGGVMPEFVNPKYKDATRTAFKSPTRLECMMQDFPWLMPPDAAVSFTLLDASLFYCPVKNALADAAKKAAAGQSPSSASAGEFALYALSARLLELAGATVERPPPRTVAGVPLPPTPQLLLAPSTRPTCFAAVGRLGGGGAIRISARSTLLLDGAQIRVDALELDGALLVRAVDGARVTLRHVRVANAGWRMEPLAADALVDAATPEVERLRGYRWVADEQREIDFDEPGEYVVDDGAH